MFRDWYHLKTTEAARNCWYGAVALIPATFIAATVTWWVIFVSLYMGLGALMELSYQATSVLCWIILGITFAWQFWCGQRHTEEYNFSGRPLSATESAAIRFSGESWTVLLFDPKAGRAFITFLAAWFVTAPKLASLAVMLHERANRLNDDQIDAYMPALKNLLAATSAISVEELARQSKLKDPGEMLRTLTAIDGVVALTQDDLALTVAPRLTHEFEEWAAAQD